MKQMQNRNRNRRLGKTFDDHLEISAQTDADYKFLWIHRNKNNTSSSEWIKFYFLDENRGFNPLNFVLEWNII